MASIAGTVLRPTVLEEPSVARYVALADTAGGFTLPDPVSRSTDRHIQGIAFPGVTQTVAVIFFRTRHTGLPDFSVRINEASLIQYTFTDADPPERTWHHIIPDRLPDGSSALFAQNNELVFFARGGTVTFGDVVILYTSNELTVKIPIVVTVGQL